VQVERIIAKRIALPIRSRRSSGNVQFVETRARKKAIRELVIVSLMKDDAELRMPFSDDEGFKRRPTDTVFQLTSDGDEA